MARLLALLTCILLVAGCGAKKVEKPPAVPPPPTFTGPAFLHGTVGSLASVRGFEPTLVSGYGLVVGLNGTGSTTAPAFLRQWLITQMRREGVGSIEMRKVLPATPEQLLASPDTAVVVIEGFMPPGATRGTHFDLLISALDSDTTSLQGGRLWTADLAVAGANPELRFSRPIARGGGATYINPLSEAVAGDDPAHERQAVILSGGSATSDRRVELVLNNPSASRSRLIADRINEVFPKREGVDERDTAMPRSDQIIQLHIPRRFAAQPQEFLDLVGHVFLQHGSGFDAEKAQQLGDLLVVEPRYARSITLAWQTLGRTTVPVLRKFYDHPSLHVKMSALEAGVRLGDERTTEYLTRLAELPDAALRRQVADLLVHLPRSERGGRALRKLLDDEDRSVRLSAYESMAAAGDPIIQRVAVGDKIEFKFVLDLVPSTKPLIYVTQKDVPRIVIFNPMLGFKSPAIARIWDNRLMLRINSPDQPIAVFHQPPGNIEGTTYEIAPTVANFVRLMAQKWSVEQPIEGMDLSYSRVVNALHSLQKQGYIAADMEVRSNRLAQLIAESREAEEILSRPEIDDVGAQAPTDPFSTPTLNDPPGTPGTPGNPGNPGNPGTTTPPAAQR